MMYMHNNGKYPFQVHVIISYNQKPFPCHHRVNIKMYFGNHTPQTDGYIDGSSFQTLGNKSRNMLNERMIKHDLDNKNEKYDMKQSSSNACKEVRG